MKLSNTAEIEYYRVQRKWNRAGHLRTIGAPYHGTIRQVPTRPWHRTHQAEWAGCQRAPRAFTRWGIHRKAERWATRGRFLWREFYGINRRTWPEMPRGAAALDALKIAVKCWRA